MVCLPYDAGLSAASETLVGIIKRVIVSPAVYTRFLEIAELARSLCHSWATCFWQGYEQANCGVADPRFLQGVRSLLRSSLPPPVFPCPRAASSWLGSGVPFKRSRVSLRGFFLDFRSLCENSGAYVLPAVKFLCVKTSSGKVLV